MLSTLSNSRSSRLTERCGYHWLKNSAANITVTSCLTKGLIISLLPCFRSLRLRPMKPIAPMQPVIQNAKLLCVTTKKRSVSLAMNVHLCVLSLHSCSRPYQRHQHGRSWSTCGAGNVGNSGLSTSMRVRNPYTPPVSINPLDRGWDILGTWREPMPLYRDPFQSGPKSAHPNQNC